MAEVCTPVDAVRVTMRCEADDGGCPGFMAASGRAQAVHPPRYEHVCNVCSSTAFLPVAYPLIRHLPRAERGSP